MFAPLRVDLHEGEVKEVEVWGTFRGNEWANKGEASSIKKLREEGVDIWAFELKVGPQKEYFLERPGCESPSLDRWKGGSIMRNLLILQKVSPFSLLKNPMILIAGVSMLIVFGMPYLMDNSKLLPVLVVHCLLTDLKWILKCEPSLKSVKNHHL